MKKYFITGLVILLPVALTLAIVIFLFNLLTEPFVGMVRIIFEHYGLFSGGFLFLNADQVQKYISQLIILLLLFFFTVGLGFLARWFFFHYLIRFWEYVMHRIPFIRSVYKACQDVINTLFKADGNSFKQVVMVPFPSSDTLAMGFVTRENLPGIGKNGKPLVAVFVPTTPNPTSGFLMMFPEDDLIFVDMKVEEALKYIISCGVIASPFQQITREEALQRLKGQMTSQI
jgi:uncharacterized membrane protein